MNQIREAEKKTLNEYIDAIDRDRFIARFRARGLSPEDAEDILQTALLKACKAFGSYNGVTPFEYWLSTIATNSMNDLYRYKERRPTMNASAIGDNNFNILNTISDASDGFEEIFREGHIKHLREIIQRCCTMLTSKESDTIKNYLAGKSAKDAVDKGLAPSTGAYSANLRKAKNKIRKGLKIAGGECTSDIF